VTALAWCVLFIGVVGAGYYGQSRLQEIQAYLENKASELFVRFGRREFDVNQSRTAMGRIGELKQSSRIVMKVKSEFGQMPERLREATFSKLDGVVWKGSGRSFDSIPVQPDATTWTIVPEAPFRAGVRIIQRADRKRALLSIPLGTVQFRELASTAVETNRYQVVQTKGNPGLLNFVAMFGDTTPEGAPWGWDKEIPEDEEQAIKSVAREIAVRPNARPEKIISAIVDFFARNFRYTTFQEARALGLHDATPLSEFLLKTRAGHCEYFASATVLLLREFGIPSRYATGYAVQELSRDDDTYVIRERHGHAWAVAYVGDKWIEVDSTPPGWEEAEASEFPFYEKLKDEWEKFSFGFLEWRWLGDWSFFRMTAPWLVIPMVLFLGWKTFGRRMSVARDHRQTRNWPGADSEFFALERKLAKAGLARLSGETSRDWIARVSRDEPHLAGNLRQALELHSRYRFDPRGITATERENLRLLVHNALMLASKRRE
jgi:transglutaminase-like putative cysteine protease